VGLGRQSMPGRMEVAIRFGPFEHLIVWSMYNNLDSRIGSKRESANPLAHQSRNQNYSGLVFPGGNDERQPPNCALTGERQLRFTLSKKQEKICGAHDALKIRSRRRH